MLIFQNISAAHFFPLSLHILLLQPWTALSVDICSKSCVGGFFLIQSYNIPQIQTRAKSVVDNVVQYNLGE